MASIPASILFPQQRNKLQVFLVETKQPLLLDSLDLLHLLCSKEEIVTAYDARRAHFPRSNGEIGRKSSIR